MRCGALGHRTGDPACRFPGSRGPDAQQGSTAKPTANLADMSDSSDDDGLQESMWHMWQCVGLGRVVLNPDHLQRLQPQLHQCRASTGA